MGVNSIGAPVTGAPFHLWSVRVHASRGSPTTQKCISPDIFSMGRPLGSEALVSRSFTSSPGERDMRLSAKRQEPEQSRCRLRVRLLLRRINLVSRSVCAWEVL